MVGETGDTTESCELVGETVDATGDAEVVEASFGDSFVRVQSCESESALKGQEPVVCAQTAIDDELDESQIYVTERVFSDEFSDAGSLQSLHRAFDKLLAPDTWPPDRSETRELCADRLGRARAVQFPIKAFRIIWSREMCLDLTDRTTQVFLGV